MLAESLPFASLALIASLASLPAYPRPQGLNPLPVPTDQPNIVLIVADDLGVDLVGAYGEGPSLPCTPNVDSLAAEGLLFRNAWTNPVCSPTRAAVLTGRYGFRTGIGTTVTSADAGLSTAIRTLPEKLLTYTTAAIGKWHLAGSQGPTHPQQVGFDYYAGSLPGALDGYYMWQKTVNGTTSTSTTYATTDAVDEAVLQIQTMAEPWFLYLAFNAPHTPTHTPPTQLCTPSIGCVCETLPQNPTDPEFVRAAVEAMDAEIGRFFSELDLVDPQAYVFFLGDNGTDGLASLSPFEPDHAKGTPYEGGINVPLIVRGPGIAPGGESAGLVVSTDLFSTIGELAGYGAFPQDSVSLVPYFSDPNADLRQTVYTEMFSPNGGTYPFPQHTQAIRNDTYKLIRRRNQPDEFYNLADDPFELNDLYPALPGGAQQAYDDLNQELIDLTSG